MIQDVSHENIILQALISNKEFTKKVIPHLEREFFENEDAILFDIILKYYNDYNTVPTKDAIFIELSNLKISENIYEQAVNKLDLLKEDTNELKWLLSMSEEWAKSRKIFLAVTESVKALEDESKADYNAIIKQFQDAIGYSFDSRIGHDYFRDAMERFDYYNSNEGKVPTYVSKLNKITKGGFSPKTLNIILAPPHTGKAQPVDTIIETPNGRKRFGDLKIGDVIFGSDGNPQYVTGIYPQGIKPVFKMTFYDGRSTECCGEHLWKTWHHEKGEKLLTTHDIGKLITSNNYNKKKTYIPLVQPIKYTETPTEIPPYVLGVIIGDGNISQKVITITNPDIEIREKVETLLPDYILLKEKKDRKCLAYSLRGATWHHNKWTDELKMLNLMGLCSPEKFIPECYLKNSVNNRLELLNGLLDTDGYVDKNGGISYTTTSERLSKDIQMLVRSLGGTAKLLGPMKKYYRYNGERKLGKPVYTVGISFPPEMRTKLFHQKKKKDRCAAYLGQRKRLRIDSVDYIGDKECMCISVSNPDKLYVTNDYIVTHNTLVMNSLASDNLRNGKNVLYITLEMSEYEIGKRIDANLLDVSMDDIERIDRNTFKNKGNAVRQNILGNLVIREYPGYSVSPLHFRALLEQLKNKEKFVPDIIYVDYLNLLASARFKDAANSYKYVGSATVELRALAQEYNIPIVSATQVNRENSTKSDYGSEAVSESFAIPMHVDLLFTIISSDDLREQGLMCWKQLKNRYSGMHDLRKFLVSVDYKKQRVFDFEGDAEEIITGYKDEIEEDQPIVPADNIINISDFLV